VNTLPLRIKAKAKDLGFDACGITPARPSGQADFLDRWLAEGRHASMTWLANRRAERADVRHYLPGARSVICCAWNYKVPLAPAPPGPRGRVGRYALGDDYHAHLKKRLHALADWLRAEAGGETRACVDTAPVLEREHHARAGVGWQGKNTCTIRVGLGSFLLLGELVTSLDLPADEPAVDRCGTCTRCIDACPTDALTPYALDPRRCISYWTIEHRTDAVPPDIKAGIGNWLFGCDICQDVCPWNRKAPDTPDPAARPRPGFETGSLDPDEILAWNATTYAARLKGTALKRVKLPQWHRNARIVKSNIKPRAAGRWESSGSRKLD
jgi:epoxyqueuosine reductase